MSPEQHADQFVAKYNGKYIDEDKYYGSQCWDVVARYAREEYGCSPFPTGSGGAEGLWRLFMQPIPKFFEKVPNSELLPGDIAVWDSSFYPPYGHTALVWRREGGTIWVFEQDGSKDPNGDGIADGVAYIAQRTITSKLAGGLRPKEGKKLMGPTPQACQILTAQTGWQKGADGKTNPNAIAYWCYGTNNPDWGNPDVLFAKWAIEVYYAGREEGQHMQPGGQYKPYSGPPLYTEGK